MMYHPDRNVNKSAIEKAENSFRFMKITEAYKVLVDEESRKAYDISQN
jgi:DnaJ-class molecular chaperone